ncbi:histidine phosphotransferase family protein [Altererythrobacter sp. KTW20L]|uniref:histidine phosphotransferase family protein n=1 Tax=Altererythrobacter sp. KTW20L TaxID=2942210 RepID=UPI0020C0BCC9|nr:histidine phosphotransferase family protein [Altererythrobacter sp. KTW20L]MCL6250926.1 histidine phosphotransferase family protein [Altererythrobacter sp. KTW20L]
MTSSLDLAALLCSRLCHDLLSPVGAINNGLELLSDEKDPEMRDRCLELLEQSARISADKLKFFRLAFGAAGGFGEMVPTEEARQLIGALVANNERLQLDWAVTERSLPKPAVKVLLNLAAIGLDSLVRGGTLAVGAEMRAGPSGRITEIAIRASGNRVAFDATIGQALDGTLDPAELSGRTAPAHMVHLLVAQEGGTLQAAHAPEALVLGVTMPAPDGLIG